MCVCCWCYSKWDCARELMCQLMFEFTIVCPDSRSHLMRTLEYTFIARRTKMAVLWESVRRLWFGICRGNFILLEIVMRIINTNEQQTCLSVVRCIWACAPIMCQPFRWRCADIVHIPIAACGTISIKSKLYDRIRNETIQWTFSSCSRTQDAIRINKMSFAEWNERFFRCSSNVAFIIEI